MAQRSIIRSDISQGRPGRITKADYFYFDIDPASKNPLVVLCGGVELCAPDFEVHRMNYPFYFLTYIIRGKGRLEFGDHSVELRTGVLTAFEPGTPHHYYADTRDPMEHLFVTFAGSQAGAWMQKSLLRTNHSVDINNTEQIFNLFEIIHEFGFDKNFYSQELCAHYLGILLLSIGLDQMQDERAGSARSSFMRCKKYIDDHFSHINFSSDAAAACFVNVRYMSSLFRQHLHITPQQYIIRLKMNRAAYLLLHSDLPINEVARVLNYDNAYHFSRGFKNIFGISPKHYREKHQ